MYLFDTHDALFEAVHRRKFYLLAKYFDGRTTRKHIELKEIPTREEAEMIMRLVSIPDTPCDITADFDLIFFKDDI